jgi:hypothetical protein
VDKYYDIDIKPVSSKYYNKLSKIEKKEGYFITVGKMFLRQYQVTINDLFRKGLMNEAEQVQKDFEYYLTNIVDKIDYGDSSTV